MYQRKTPKDGKIITRHEIATDVAKQMRQRGYEIDDKSVEKAVTILNETILKHLEQGHSVVMYGFGKYSTRWSTRQKANNPATVNRHVADRDSKPKNVEVKPQHRMTFKYSVHTRQDFAKSEFAQNKQ